LTSFGMQNLAGESSGWNLTIDECTEAGFVPDILLCTQAGYDRWFVNPQEEAPEEPQDEEGEEEPEENEEAASIPFADARFVTVSPILFSYQSYHMLTALDELCHELSADYSGYSLPEPEPPPAEESSSQ
ncbi:MAG: hypothetical protein IJP37_00515, partial [Clostridia bacterium]|nr:hypothetical protein [Clostridia bacterium]